MTAAVHSPSLLSAVLLLSASLAGAVAADPPDYDQIVAHIPGELATIAPVALAELRITLHRAKREAALSLCDGNWMPEGELLQELGPLPVALSGGGSLWIYQASWRALPLACEHTSRARFFQEMSRHLPEWVSISPAGGLSTYRQGRELALPQTGLAVR